MVVHMTTHHVHIRVVRMIMMSKVRKLQDILMIELGKDDHTLRKKKEDMIIKNKIVCIRRLCSHKPRKTNT